MRLFFSVIEQFAKMKKYIEVKLELTPCNETIKDIVMAQMSEIGYDSFKDEDDNTILAYTEEAGFCGETLVQAINDLPIDLKISYTTSTIEEKNWNEEWEKNYFDPIMIDDICVVKSSFHKNVPDRRYTITINPKMAFGTGHHQTTVLMLQEILKADLTGQTVLDMGCGTAILAIMASMRGAKDVVAIDIDEWAYDNAIENLALNDINNVTVRIGGADLLGDTMFDTIIANINRNILLQDMQAYSSVLNKGGILYMSGFYTEDIAKIEEEALKHSLTLDSYSERDNWAGVKFSKK